ncbi:hypothetical protein AVEN_213246-1, partial [Araneus ventricosus]
KPASFFQLSAIMRWWPGGNLSDWWAAGSKSDSTTNSSYTQPWWTLNPTRSDVPYLVRKFGDFHTIAGVVLTTDPSLSYKIRLKTFLVELQKGT